MSYQIILGQKSLTKEIDENSEKYLNYTKSLCITCCPKLFWYSQCKYCSQEEAAHYGLKKSKTLDPKNHLRKLDKIHRF